MKKILIISTVGLTYDGITNIILSLLQAMNRSGFEIYVAQTMKFEPQIIKKLENLGCKVFKLPDRKKETLFYIFKLMYFIKSNNIDIIHVNGNSGTLAIEMFAAWLGGCKKRIAHSHNTKCEQVKADKFFRPMFNCFYTEALACSQDAGKWLFGERPFIVLKNGRNVAEFAFNEHIRSKVRNQWNLGKNVTIGHVGGFVPQKNHSFLIQVYREILKLRPNARFFMVGDGPLKKEIESLCEDIKENIFFTGNVDYISDLLQAMDAMILPSLFEGLPLVAIEWQINGLPALISENVTKECKLVPFIKFKKLTDPHLWAQEILELIENTDRNVNSKFGIESIQKNGFDIQNSANILRNLYLGNNK